MPTPPPSDDELTSLWDTLHFRTDPAMDSRVLPRSFGRAVLAKWGASSASIEEKREAFIAGAICWGATAAAFARAALPAVTVNDITRDAERKYPLPVPRPREQKAREVRGNPKIGEGRLYKYEDGQLLSRAAEGDMWVMDPDIPERDRLIVADLLATPTEDM